MTLRNSTAHWGWPAKALHWIGAILILLLLGHGWWMTHLAPRPDRLANYAWHAALGYDFLVLLVLRLLWRWLNPVPAMPAGTKRWEEVAARAGHLGLYLLMFATTLVGWALAGTMRTPMTKDVFGLTIPAIVSDKSLHGALEDTHKWLAYVLAALTVVHIAGALRHHFVKRNDVLRRMAA
jgi:cytochrome b561